MGKDKFRRIAVNGVTLVTLDEGEGEPVLLLHGFPDDHQVWRRQIPALVAAGYRVIAPDLRGCGQSDMPDAVSDYRIENLVADVAGLLDALGIDKVRLIAHDWGAVIGWRLCMAHPERISRYAALSVGHPTAYAKGPLIQKLKGYYILLIQMRGIAEMLLKARNWWLLRQVTRYPAEAPQWIANLSRPGRLTAALNYYRANFDMLLPREWPHLAMPVLGIWSDRDIALCRAQMTDSARYVDGPWRFEVVEGANHWLNLDAPERVNPLLIEFLEGKVP